MPDFLLDALAALLARTEAGRRPRKVGAPCRLGGGRVGVGREAILLNYLKGRARDQDLTVFIQKALEVSPELGGASFNPHVLIHRQVSSQPGHHMPIQSHGGFLA